MKPQHLGLIRLVCADMFVLQGAKNRVKECDRIIK